MINGKSRAINMGGGITVPVPEIQEVSANIGMNFQTDISQSLTTVNEEYYEYFESIKWIEDETLEIEFDAHVLYITPHEKYNTRCELLIASGDFNNGEFNGPYIKTRDIGYIELNGIDEGTNVRIKAEIEKYDKDAGWLKIRIIDIESR